MKRLAFLGLVSFFLFTACGLPSGVSSSLDFKKADIKDEFCGIHINYQYCKCAFHGDYCDEIGMTRKEADKYVEEEYDKWLSGDRDKFNSECTDANGYLEGDTCYYCEDDLIAKDGWCQQPTAEDLAAEDAEEVQLPDGPYNDDCTLKQDEFDADWKKYSDIDNAIAKSDRSYEAQQALTAYETMIGKLVEVFEIQRDIEIEEQMQVDLTEYRQALVQNQKTNLLKAFWRMSWVTYSTVKSGVSAGSSYSKLMTSAGSAVQSIASGLKTFQATIPSSSDLAIDKSTLLGKTESVGAKTVLEAVESLGDPTKVAIRFVKSATDVSLPSANLTDAEIKILQQQQIDKGIVDQVLAASNAANDARLAKVSALEAEIKQAEADIADWEAKEKQRVADVLVESCKKLTTPEESTEQPAEE